MASNFVGPDIHDSEIVRRYQQMVPNLKDKLEKAIRLYSNMVRQHAECHEGDVFRLDTSEYSRQLAEVVRHLDEMQLLLSTISSWGCLPAECLFPHPNRAGPDADGGRLDFNALEAEGRAQLEQVLAVQAVLQKCRPSQRKKEEAEEALKKEEMEEDEAAASGLPGAFLDMEVGVPPQVSQTSAEGMEEEDDDEEDEDEDDEDEDEEEEERRSAATTTQLDASGDDLPLSPPAVVAARSLGTPHNPGSVPVHSMQTPPPPPPPRPSTSSGRVSTPQHLHSIQPSPVDILRGKDDMRSGPPSSEGVASDSKVEEGSNESLAAPPMAAPSMLSGLMRGGSHSNSPASGGEPVPLAEPVTSAVGSLLQQQLSQRQQQFMTLQYPVQAPGQMTFKSEPTSHPLHHQQQQPAAGLVKTEAMEQEEGQMGGGHM